VPEHPRFGGRAALAVAALFIVLGLAFTAPLATHLRDGLPYAAVPPEGRETSWRVQGDYLQFYYYLWLVRDRLAAGASFLRDPYQFAVDGPRLNLPNTFLPVALLYVPLSLVGPRLAYNALVLLSFAGAGVATALLARRYGLSRSAALVAGVVFACAPYRVGALLGGHPAGLAYGLWPLAVWGLEGAVTGSLGGGVWCAVALVSLAIVEPHFFYFAALALPLYLGLRVALDGWTPAMLAVDGRRWILAVVIAAAPAWGAVAALARQGWTPPGPARVALGVLVAAAALVLWQAAAGWLRATGVFSDPRVAAERSLLACVPWLATAAAGTQLGARLALAGLAVWGVIHAAWHLAAWPRWRAALPVPPLVVAGVGALGGSAFLWLLRQALLRRSVSGTGRTLHEVMLYSPLPSDLLVRVNPLSHRAIYLGLVALALAAVGAVGLARRPPAGAARMLLGCVPLLALATVLSLGMRLPGLPLFEAAFRLVPFWNFVRQPAKLQVLASLALALLAAAGAQALASRARRAWVHVAVAAILALLIAAEYHPWRPIGVSLLPGAGPDEERIASLGPRALFIPLWPGDSSYSGLYLYATTLTRVPMLNGYSAWVDRSYVTDVYRALETVNLGAVGETEYAALRRYGVRQVVLDREAFPLKVSAFGPAFTLASLQASPFLELARPAADDEAVWVFRVRDRAAAGAREAPRSPLGIYWEAESLSRDTGEITADTEASNGRVVLARTGRDRPGFLTFGPYRLLPAGPFRAVFRLRGESSAVALQVTAAGGRQILGSRGVVVAGGEFADVSVPFVLPAPVTVEYRVKWDGTGWVAADAVSVTFEDVLDPAPAFEVEDLGHELLERTDGEASGARAGYADPERTPRDAVWSGPLRRYPAGVYRLWVRLKLDRAVSGSFAWCGVRAASRGPTVGGRDLTGADVPEVGRYVELPITFVLDRASVLELPCIYRGRVGVWFDRLRIERVGS
jgi:hypothetical protein